MKLCCESVYQKYDNEEVERIKHPAEKRCADGVPTVCVGGARRLLLVRHSGRYRVGENTTVRQSLQMRGKCPCGSKGPSGHCSHCALDFRQYCLPALTMSPCISLKTWTNGSLRAKLMREGRCEA